MKLTKNFLSDKGENSNIYELRFFPGIVMGVAKASIILKISLLLFFFLIVSTVSSQTHFSLKAEVGYLNYRFNTIQIDPSPGWNGYYLDGQNGIDCNLGSGIDLGDHVYAGIGLGYLNFEGIHGCSIFPEIEYSPFNLRLAPFISFRFGYCHIWNQYEKGTATTIGDMSAGLIYELTDQILIYIKAGFISTQQSLFIPVKFGIRF